MLESCNRREIRDRTPKQSCKYCKRSMVYSTLPHCIPPVESVVNKCASQPPRCLQQIVHNLEGVGVTECGTEGCPLTYIRRVIECHSRRHSSSLPLQGRDVYPERTERTVRELRELYSEFLSSLRIFGSTTALVELLPTPIPLTVCVSIVLQFLFSMRSFRG